MHSSPPFKTTWSAGGVALVGIIMLVAGCDPRKQSSEGRPSVPPMSALTVTGRLKDKRLLEASGAVGSMRQPGLFWSQNDSGNDALLFAYDSTGRALGTTAVQGFLNVDWEALATGPCPQGRCLYLGDVGDNDAVRTSVTILRFNEPDAAAATTGPVQQLQLRFPDGARDVEAIWVAPDTRVWLATKRPLRLRGGAFRPVQLYRLPAEAWRQNAVAVAQRVDSLPIIPQRSSSRDWVTDASLSELDERGRRSLAVLTYGSVYIFDANPVSGRPGAQRAHCAVAVKERYSEGITWLPDGRLMLVNEGRKSSLYRGRCP